MADADVLVVGAGLSGLTAARALHASGRTVTLLDKSVGPGGRLATRRIGDATVDHGAQFFTVRSDEFAELTKRWHADGAPIEMWSHGFTQATDIREGPAGVTATGGDGHSRYVVSGGMNVLAKHLASGLDVVCDTLVVSAWVDHGAWRVTAVGPCGPVVHTGRALLCTAPVPQTRALLDRGAVTLPSPVTDALDTVRYDPCLALLAVLDAPPEIPGPGGVQFAGGPVRWLADNHRKSTSARPAITLHAEGGWSAGQYDCDDAAVDATLRAWLAPWLGDAAIVTTQVKRWRYAQPTGSVDQPTIAATIDGAAIAFAGDAFGPARVEGAALSGLAAAAALRSPKPGRAA